MNDASAEKNVTLYRGEELTHFKQLLKKQEQQTQQHIEELEESVEDLTDREGDEYASASHHQGNFSNREKETGLELLGRNRNELSEIRAALD